MVKTGVARYQDEGVPMGVAEYRGSRRSFERGSPVCCNGNVLCQKGRDRREGSVGRPSHMKEVEVVGNGRILGGCLREFVDGGELMS
jgi:threonine dehydrogenase-like Zn-dependent dehydrogenase